MDAHEGGGPLHERAKAVFFAALELPREEREALVRARCEGDPALEREVRSLLAQEITRDGFLARPLDLGGRAGAEERPPARIGAYRVLRRLGHGAMGVVYLAEQDRPRRRVAVKVLRRDAASETARQRFARESLALGRLSHANIAGVLEAGVAETDVGPQLFIAIEYVEGERIDRYAALHGLDRPARIALIAQVARAVAHAHERGVLHRDLKPDNVLVDAEGRPRVLDFGVAQVAGEEQELTATGQVLGTLAYMSPEQARGARVDERSDVYSLGVMLYELLTGHLPFETRGRPLHAAFVTRLEGATVPAARRDPSLRGDLDAILATALADDPARRYRSVADFADDLERFLAGRPVAARPPSGLYLASRFAARHKALVAGVAVALVSLLGLALGLGVMLRARADAEAVSRVASLLSDLELLGELEAEEGRLWPADSSRIASMDRWLATARSLVARVDRHAATLAELESDGSLAGVDLPDEDMQRVVAQANALVARIQAFAAPAEGLLARVAERRGRAASLWARSVKAHAAEWEAARARVRRNPVYGGLELARQEGLVPLGPDPESGLEEFALLDGTGAPPARASGASIACGEETGLVLVLVPGGDVWIGYQADDPSAPGYSENGHRADGRLDAPNTTQHYGPPRWTRLAPFLLSKFEMTQEQWWRAFGLAPSEWTKGEELPFERIGGAHPVETLSHDDAMRLLPRLGLTLPTEAQWEHAARGGRPSAYPPAELADPRACVANLRYGPLGTPGGVFDDADGAYMHAPVGSFRPNGYGLHDVLGNVEELCLDDYKVDYHGLLARAGDGLVTEDGDPDRTKRGSAWLTLWHSAHEGVRVAILHGDGGNSVGVRPARALVGCDFATESASHGATAAR